MPELRWILLFVGAVLVAGLWWWEARRSRAARRAALGDVDVAVRAPERAEPSLEGETGRAGADVEIASIRVAPDERRPAGLNPPVLTIDGLPEDPDHVVLADGAAPGKGAPVSARRDDGVGSARASAVFSAGGEGAAVGAAPGAGSAAGSPGAQRHAETPTSSAASATAGAAGVAGAAGTRTPAPRVPSRAPAADERASAQRSADSRPAESPVAQQRIVAIRLVARTEQLIDGAELRDALEAAGLRFGKYSIFHRQRADGRAIYSIASLLEPGSFDLDRMETLLFPGISMFAVFPGPVDAPEVFDEMLVSARRLAERLDAAIQDEHGVPFTAQRALILREELVHFQGLVARTRQR